MQNQSDYMGHSEILTDPHMHSHDMHTHIYTIHTTPHEGTHLIHSNMHKHKNPRTKECKTTVTQARTIIFCNGGSFW